MYQGECVSADYCSEQSAYAYTAIYQCVSNGPEVPEEFNVNNNEYSCKDDLYLFVGETAKCYTEKDCRIMRYILDKSDTPEFAEVKMCVSGDQCVNEYGSFLYSNSGK